MADTVTVGYRDRMKTLRGGVEQRMRLLWSELVNPDQLDDFAGFTNAAANLAAGGQDAAAALTSSYHSARITQAGLAPLPLPPPTFTRTQASQFDAISSMVKDKIGSGMPTEEAMDYGRSLAVRTADGEVTTAIDAASRAPAARSRGWVGVVRANACKECQSKNGGTHEWNTPMYRHPGCDCSQELLFGTQTETPTTPLPPKAQGYDALKRHGINAKLSQADLKALGPRHGLDKMPAELRDRVIGFYDAAFKRWPKLATSARGVRSLYTIRVRPTPKGELASFQAGTISLNSRYFESQAGLRQMTTILSRQASTKWAHGTTVESGVLQHELGHVMDSWIRFNGPFGAYSKPGSPAYMKWQDYESWRNRTTVAATGYGKGDPAERVAEFVTRAIDLPASELTAWEREGLKWFEEAGLKLQ